MAITTAAALIGSAVIGAGSAAASSRSAKKAQSKGQKRAQATIERSAEQARQDIAELFPQAQAAREAGFGRAQDIFAQGLPQQAQLFQQGNIAAQQSIAQSPQQIQNALLGLPTDFSFLQPQQFTPDFSFLQRPIEQPQEQTPLVQPAALPQDLQGFRNTNIVNALRGRQIS